MNQTISTFSTFFASFKGFNFKTFFAETLPHGVSTELSLAIVILVVFGLVECLFGWQLLRIQLTLSVFVAGIAASAYVTDTNLLDAYLPETWMVWFIMVVVALSLAIFTWYHCNLAFFLATFIGSAALLFVLFSGTIGNVAVAAGLSAALAIPIAFLLKQLLMPAMVAFTALGGALIVAFSISGFLYSFMPSIGLMLMTDLTVTGLVMQVRRLLKSKVNNFMSSTMRSTNSFLSRYEGDVSSISRNFFSRIGF